MTLHYANLDVKSDAELRTRTAPKVPARPSPIYRHFFKRVLDIVLSAAGLLLVLPIIAVFALLIARDGHNPFYSQKRLGRGGQIFRMWKLRSMVPDAEARLADYLEQNPDAQAEWKACQKLKDDPRITWIGKFLRKTSIDELPQLINVLNGTMSLVGPRPIMVSQKDLYKGMRYYRMRPGITGLWQISLRNETTFETRVAFDDYYEADISFTGDIKILLKTIRPVLRGTGY